MALMVYREPFVGKYDGVTPATLLEPGDLSDGENVRKVSSVGGWKVRKGCLLHNTTALESGEGANSLHQYKAPRGGDYHFITQCNSKLLVSPQDPPTIAGGTAYTDLGVSVGTTPGFSCVVDETFFYADGSGRPIAWGGDTPSPIGFFVYDASETAYIDYTRVVTDGRNDIEGIILGAATDKIYLVTSEPCEGFVINLGSSVNSNAVTLTVKAWRSGAWASVSSIVDGTDSPVGTTLAIDGTVTWTRSALDEMRIIQNTLGYAYEIGWSGAMSANVRVISVTVKMDANPLTNKWNGEWEWVTGALFFDQSALEYQDVLGKVLNESTSQYLDLSEATTSDFLYIKAAEPVIGFGFGISVGYANSANAEIDQIDYWNGSAWTAITTGITDTTMDDTPDSSFSQTGKVTFDASAITPQRRTLEGDDFPGYWYRISWDASLSTDTRIFAIFYAPFPITIPTYEGCVEFKDRLFVWGDPEYPNRLRYSAEKRPDCFSGADSRWTRAFGGADKILCALKFYNELIVFKRDSVYLLEGYGPSTFGNLRIADTIGLASPKTAYVAEVGSPEMHQDEAMSVAIWQDTDGIYILDGRKPKKVSGPVANYFDQEYSECIAAASIQNRQAFTQPLQNEYHFLLPAGELVYNYATNEWYPPWDREIDLDTGLSFRGADNRYYTYGGSSTGWVMKLEDDTSDKTIANADKAISHSVKTRAITIQGEQGAIIRSTLRKIWGELKVKNTGNLTVKTFADMATTGVTVTALMSMVSSGKGMIVPEEDCSVQKCSCFQIEFSLAVIDAEMEIWSCAYAVEARGLPNV